MLVRVMPWFWSRPADQRKWRRTACRGTAVMVFGKTSVPGAVIDLGRGGCLFQPATPPLFLDRQATLTLAGEQLGVRLVRRSRRGQHLCFALPLEEQQHDDILDAISRERRGIIADADAADWLAAKGRRRPPGRNS